MCIYLEGFAHSAAVGRCFQESSEKEREGEGETKTDRECRLNLDELKHLKAAEGELMPIFVSSVLP